jgi:hypothetical protein
MRYRQSTRAALTSAAITALALIAEPSLSLAEPAPPPAPTSPPAPTAPTTTDKEVSALLRQGNIAAGADRFAEALGPWRAAYALRPDFENACNIGRAAFRIGAMRLAAEYLVRCVRDAPEPSTPAEKARQRDELDELASARREVGSISVAVSKPDADVILDGVLIGRSPLPETLFVEPGSHHVRAAIGRESAEARVDAAKGSSHTITLTLREPPPPTLSAPEPTKTKQGPPGYILARSSSNPPGAGPPTRAGGLGSWILIGGGSLTALVLGTGVVLAALAADKEADFERDASTILRRTPQGCSRAANDSKCPALRDAGRASADLATAAAVTFAGAGILGAATLAAHVLFGRRGRAALTAPPGLALTAPTALVLSLAPTLTGRGIEMVGVW